MKPCKIAIGDSITFKAATRSHYKTATRKVVGVSWEGLPQVRYHGYSGFIVHWHEISAITKGSAA